MDFAQFQHEAKSRDAYMHDAKTVHLRLRVKKGLTRNVKVIYGDPFLYEKQADTNRHAWSPFQDGAMMAHRGQSPHHDLFFIATRPKHLRMKYAFLIDDRYLFGAREVVDLEADPDLRYNLFNYFNFPYLNDEDLFNAPAWSKDQVWYSIFPERFHNGDQTLNHPDTKAWDSVEDFTNADKFGGDLRGIITKLDYIASMGFTGLYLTPIFKAMSTHKYDTTDYFEIDPAFGTKADLKELIEKAHAKGIRIMLDAVFNHVGMAHPFFLDVVANGKKSEYYDCFYIIDETKPVLPVSPEVIKAMSYREVKQLFADVDALNYRTFAFTPFMPKVRVMHPKMKAYFLEVATYWIETFDIDGWRLDVSNEIPHAFWRAFRKVVKAAKPDAYIVGENWDNSMPWLQGDQYDAVMNYEILFPIWQFFGPHPDFKALNAETFIERINQALFAYPDNVLTSMYNLVDSHDTARIKHICGEDVRKVKLAYAFLFSFPGSPSIFYGGEIGLSGDHDPKNRRCMPWNQDRQDDEMKTFIQTLIRLRRQVPALKSTRFDWLPASKGGLLAFKKDELLVVMNNQDQKTTLKLPESDKTDLLTGRQLGSVQTLELEPYQLYFLK